MSGYFLLHQPTIPLSLWNFDHNTGHPPAFSVGDVNNVTPKLYTNIIKKRYFHWQ